MTTSEALLEAPIKSVVAGKIAQGQIIVIEDRHYTVEGTATAGNDKVLLELSNGPYLSTIIADVNKEFPLV